MQPPLIVRVYSIKIYFQNGVEELHLAAPLFRIKLSLGIALLIALGHVVPWILFALLCFPRTVVWLGL